MLAEAVAVCCTWGYSSAKGRNEAGDVGETLRACEVDDVAEVGREPAGDPDGGGRVIGDGSFGLDEPVELAGDTGV